MFQVSLEGTEVKGYIEGSFGASGQVISFPERESTKERERETERETEREGDRGRKRKREGERRVRGKGGWGGRLKRDPSTRTLEPDTEPRKPTL